MTIDTRDKDDPLTDFDPRPITLRGRIKRVWVTGNGSDVMLLL